MKPFEVNQINKDILIEDLIEILPDAVTYLMERGIRCLQCGEPIWGTLETAAKEKGFNKNNIEEFIKDLNKMAEKRIK
jgi:methionine synthase II (cobalamin-independent)